MRQQVRLLRISFAAGAVTDALALGPMLVPAMARLMWGFDDTSVIYQYAMGYGAALMLGWTLLLLWAYQRPIERKAVALLTNAVILGLIAAEVNAVYVGAIAPERMAPTWVLQAVLLSLFAAAYHYPSSQPSVAAPA